MSTSGSLKSFQASRFTFETRSESGTLFQAVTTRYIPASQFEDDSMSADEKPRGPTSGYILTLVHGAGFPKELWERVIARLFDVQSDMQYASIATGVPTPTAIRELWTVESLDVGEAGKLNEKILAGKSEFGPLEYANALATFQKEFLTGKLKDNYTEEDKFVLVAHSVGCSEAILATSFFTSPSVLRSTFHSIILVEPILLLDPARQSTVAKFFNEKERKKAYKRNASGSKPAAWRLNEVCSIIPVHAIFGSVNDVLSQGDKNSLEDPSQGRKMTSLSKVEGIGHWIPQTAPQKMAEVVFNVLQQFGGLQAIKSGDTLRSKL